MLKICYHYFQISWTIGLLAILSFLSALTIIGFIHYKIYSYALVITSLAVLYSLTVEDNPYDEYKPDIHNDYL